MLCMPLEKKRRDCAGLLALLAKELSFLHRMQGSRARLLFLRAGLPRVDVGHKRHAGYDDNEENPQQNGLFRFHDQNGGYMESMT